MPTSILNYMVCTVKDQNGIEVCMVATKTLEEVFVKIVWFNFIFTDKYVYVCI